MDSLINLVHEPAAALGHVLGLRRLATGLERFDLRRNGRRGLQPNQLRRLHDSRFWIYKGLDVYKRGIENNPTSYQLWERTAQCYYQRLKDYKTAAYYYQNGRASSPARRSTSSASRPTCIDRFHAQRRRRRPTRMEGTLGAAHARAARGKAALEGKDESQHPHAGEQVKRPRKKKESFPSSLFRCF